MSNKRKSLSLDVMQQFMKDPIAATQPSSTEVITEKLADTNTDSSTEVNDDILTDVNPEVSDSPAKTVEPEKKSSTTRPKQQAKAKSTSSNLEERKPKERATATKTEESRLSADVIEMFKTAQKEATTRFTVDLPQSQHRQFAIVSKQLNTNMSNLARVLIEKFLSEIERDGLL